MGEKSASKLELIYQACYRQITRLQQSFVTKLSLQKSTLNMFQLCLRRQPFDTGCSSNCFPRNTAEVTSVGVSERRCFPVREVLAHKFLSVHANFWVPQISIKSPLHHKQGTIKRSFLQPHPALPIFYLEIRITC